MKKPSPFLAKLKDEVKLSLHLLSNYPLYSQMSSEEKISVLVIGGTSTDEFLFEFISLCFNTVLMAGYKLRLSVVIPNPQQFHNILLERLPELEAFYSTFAHDLENTGYDARAEITISDLKEYDFSKSVINPPGTVIFAPSTYMLTDQPQLANLINVYLQNYNSETSIIRLFNTNTHTIKTDTHISTPHINLVTLDNLTDVHLKQLDKLADSAFRTYCYFNSLFSTNSIAAEKAFIEASYLETYNAFSYALHASYKRHLIDHKHQIFRQGISPKTLIGKRYELLYELGSVKNGMAFLVQDTALIKPWMIIALRKGEAESLSFYLKEIQFLNHSALPRIIDIIEECGSIFLVSEVVKGTPLDKHALQIDTIVECITQLAEAMSYLQNHGLMLQGHIEPSDIMLSDHKIKLMRFDIMPLGQKDITHRILSDIAKIFHFLLTGITPDCKQIYVPSSENNASYFDEIIQKCLHGGFDSIKSFLYELEGYKIIEQRHKSIKRESRVDDKMNEFFREKVKTELNKHLEYSPVQRVIGELVGLSSVTVSKTLSLKEPTTPTVFNTMKFCSALGIPRETLWAILNDVWDLYDNFVPEE